MRSIDALVSFDRYVFEDSLVCPFTPERPGEMQVVCVDEATSSVDPESERKIQAALETTLRGRTSIVIAHRFATVRSADRILVLHRGVVREEGTHDELMRLAGGIYRTLHELREAGASPRG